MDFERLPVLKRTKHSSTVFCFVFLWNSFPRRCLAFLRNSLVRFCPILLRRDLFSYPSICPFPLSPYPPDFAFRILLRYRFPVRAVLLLFHQPIQITSFSWHEKRPNLYGQARSMGTDIIFFASFRSIYRKKDRAGLSFFWQSK